MSKCLSVFAAAKLNLFLKVYDRLLDGYHRIETIFQSIDLYDHLFFELPDEKPEGQNGLQLVIKPIGQLASRTPLDKHNLIYQAAREFIKKAGITYLNLTVHLDKRIPIAGGMAGGSSNAAATLYALNYLLGEPLQQNDLLSVARMLGSDLPFCLLGGCMLGTGRGDQLTRLPSSEGLLFVLILPPPGVELKAKDVYARFSELSDLKPSPDMSIEKFLEVLMTDKKLVSKYLFNSLEEAAISLNYWVDKAKSAIDSRGFHSLLSGSGPTVFTIADDETEALNLIRELKEEGYEAKAFRAINEPFYIMVH